MADDIGVNIVNEAAFLSALADARRSVAEPKVALGEAARELVAQAHGNAPKRSGRLAGSHRAMAAAGDRVRIVTDTPYAAPVHWGWPGHGIKRQPWLVATWMRNPVPLERMVRTIQGQIDQAAGRT